jgi:hypothetical protein
VLKVQGTEAARLRVVKKLPVAAKGAIKLAAQFGDALVCVRHRIDAQGQFRYTTVELLVDKAPIRPRVEAMVYVRIGAREDSLQRVVRAAGAQWDHRARLWCMPKRLVGVLRLTPRIVPK